MNLDPEIERLVKMLESMQTEPFSEANLAERRKMADNKPFPMKPENLRKISNLKFSHHGIEIPMRLYEPEARRDSLILFFHGGGFVFGSIESHDDLCRIAANRSGCSVLSVEYRLAPENKFPAAVEDGYEAYLWARKNAKTLGVDPDRIGVSGDSAGGNISASLSMMLRDQGIQVPKLQALLYPSLGRLKGSSSMKEFADGPYLKLKDMEFFGRAYLRDERDLTNPYFAPAGVENLSGLPEAIIATAEFDPLRDEGEIYLSRLRNAGVPATGIRAKGMIHGFGSFISVVPAAMNIISMIWTLAGERMRSA